MRGLRPRIGLVPEELLNSKVDLKTIGAAL
jgi:hypothetical protein